MTWIYYNTNPRAARVGDCAIRAVSIATGNTWEEAYIDLCLYGFMHGDLPSANSVWGRYLKDKGFRRHIIPDSCPSCYTVTDFAEEHKTGIYVLGLNGHVVTIRDGNIYDSWDSSDEVPVYYWTKEE